MAADFFVVPTATCRLLFVLVMLAHERRRVVHVAVTEHPTAAWTAQQLREAFPWDESPRYLIRDRDHAFNAWANTTTAMDIREIRTAPRSPWQNAYVERFIGSVRRECLDHVIVCTERGLRRVLNAVRGVLPHSRTHLALEKDAPVSRPDRSTRGWRHHGDCSSGWLAPPLRTPRCVAHASQGAVPTVGASAPKRAPQCARFQSRVRLTRQLASNTTFFPIALQARGEMMPSRGSIVFIEDANGPSPIEFSVKTGSPSRRHARRRNWEQVRW